MKVFWIFIQLTIIPFSLVSQTFKIGSNGDYSILVDERVEIRTDERSDNGYVDYYVLRDDSGFAYLMSITKVNPPLNSDSDFIYKSDYLESFKNECGCKVIDSENASLIILLVFYLKWRRSNRVKK